MSLAESLGRWSVWSLHDIDATVAGLRAHGAELVGEVAQYQDSYRLCCFRGPRGSSSRWLSSSANGPSQSTCDKPERSAGRTKKRQ
jgi:hypothetical protein